MSTILWSSQIPWTKVLISFLKHLKKKFESSLSKVYFATVHSNKTQQALTIEFYKVVSHFYFVSVSVLVIVSIFNRFFFQLGNSYPNINILHWEMYECEKKVYVCWCSRSMIKRTDLSCEMFCTIIKLSKLHTIRMIYEMREAYLRIKEMLNEWLSPKHWVRQGYVISCWVFHLWING